MIIYKIDYAEGPIYYARIDSVLIYTMFGQWLQSTYQDIINRPVGTNRVIEVKITELPESVQSGLYEYLLG